MKRTLIRTAPTWVTCDPCGSDDIEIVTFPDNDDTEMVYDGDYLTCRDCGASASTIVDDDDAFVSDWDAAMRYSRPATLRSSVSGRKGP